MGPRLALTSLESAGQILTAELLESPQASRTYIFYEPKISGLTRVVVTQAPTFMLALAQDEQRSLAVRP